MKKHQLIIDVRPVRSELVSAREFLRLTQENPGLIERAEFSPPHLGSRGFGKFEVKYSRPRHRQVSNG